MRPSRLARSVLVEVGQVSERVPVELQPVPPLLGGVERLGVLGVDVLQRPRAGGVGPERVPLGGVLHRSDRLDVHQQQDVGGLAAGVGQVGELAGREPEMGADLVVERRLEGAPALALRELDQLLERPSDRDQVADLVEEVAVLVPAEHERVEVDDVSPEALGILLDPAPQGLEGVEQRPLTPSGSAGERVQQQADVRRLLLRLAGHERPDLRRPADPARCHPSARRSPGHDRSDPAPAWPRLRSSAFTSSASVSGIRPTFSRVNRSVESTSCGASYQSTLTRSNR